MTIEITSIDELSEDDITSKREELTAFIQEKYPEIDLTRGVFSSLVLELNAIIGAKFELELERWKASRSIKAIETDPTLADDEAVEHVLSNYNVTRKSGSFASGSVSLVFSKDISYILPIGFSFTCNGITFSTTQSYALYSSNSVPIDSDSLTLTALKTGGYGCQIDVTATVAGSAGCIRKNTELEIVTPMTSLIKAYATDDFIGGTDTETNQVMLTRFKSGLASCCWGNRYNIEALIRSQTSHLVDISVIGCGDVEMTRDQLTLFPISVGGKTDLYVKTSATTSTKNVQLNACLQSLSGNTATWSVIIPANILPGFWSVVGIESVTENLSGEILSQTNISTGTVSSDDCFYSVYQSREITFTTGFTNTQLYGTHLFEFTLYGCPYIDEIQTLVTSEQYKPISSNVLVHAPVPCEVYVTVHLNYGCELSSEQELTIQTDLAKFINNTGFNKPLLVSDLIPIVQQTLTGTQKVSSIQLDGIIQSPTLKTKRLSSNQYLVIPELPSEGITPRLVTYFTQLDYIAFQFNTEL